MRLAWMILAGVLVGGFLSVAALALGGAGHGSVWPLMVYVGIGGTIGPNAWMAWAWFGPLLYGVYGAVARMIARPAGAVRTGAALLVFHYINVAAGVFFWRLELSDDHLDIAVFYQPLWFVSSVVLFLGLHGGLVWIMFGDRPGVVGPG